MLIFTWLLEPETWPLYSDSSFSNYSQVLPPLSFPIILSFSLTPQPFLYNNFYSYSDICLDATSFWKDFLNPTYKLGTLIYLHSTSYLPIKALIATL